MLTYTQDTIRTDAITLASKINNFLDCDVVHDAQKQLIKMGFDTKVEEMHDALQYLFAAVNYRKTEKWMIEDLLAIIRRFAATRLGEAVQS